METRPESLPGSKPSTEFPVPGPLPGQPEARAVLPGDEPAARLLRDRDLLPAEQAQRAAAVREHEGLVVEVDPGAPEYEPGRPRGRAVDGDEVAQVLLRSQDPQLVRHRLGQLFSHGTGTVPVP